MSDIDQTLYVNASREAVFKALTSATELSRWFPSKVESDPRPGGKLKLIWEFTAAEENGSQEVKYLEVIPGEKVSYEWKAGPTAVPTIVTFELSGPPHQTTVRLVHSGWPNGAEGEQLRAGHVPQWSFFLGNLKSFLESGIDERAAKLKQKTF
jgi:uncharacterized protein YndB with AHSA1/START domain